MTEAFIIRESSHFNHARLAPLPELIYTISPSEHCAMSNLKAELQAVSPSQQAGRLAEDAALSFLLTQGHELISRNAYCRRGEIDLITLHQGWLIFTEVRWRSRADYGGAAASLTARKQRRIIASASYFLCSQKQWQQHKMRFDVILFAGSPPDWQRHWLQAAFTAF